MRCKRINDLPEVRNEMNHHADKLMDPVRPEEIKHVNRRSAAVEEMHYCPGCGGVSLGGRNKPARRARC
jgi:hypothetical protein